MQMKMKCQALFYGQSKKEFTCLPSLKFKILNAHCKYGLSLQIVDLN